MSFAGRLERAGRKKLNGLFRVLTVRGGSVHYDEPENILVLRIDNRMGNLILLTPFLNSLEDRFPKSRVSLLVSGRFADVLEGRGWNLVRMNKKGQIKHPGQLRLLLKEIRSAGFDTVVDASHPHGFSLSTAMLSALTRIPERIGSPSAEGKGWYNSVPPDSAWPGRTVHESQALHALGNVWESWPVWHRPSIRVKPVEKRAVVGFHAGGKPGRAFSSERLRALTSEISRLRPVIIYWGTEEERMRAEAVAGGGVTAVPAVSLKDLPESFASLEHFVTPDTGPMHLASAVNTSVTAVFSVDNVQRFRPLSPGSAALLNPSDEEIVSSVHQSLQAFR